MPSNEKNLPKKELEGPQTSITYPVGESSPIQGVVSPNVESEGIPIEFPVVQEPIRPDKDESSQASKSLSDTRPPSSSKVTDESANEVSFILFSILTLFTVMKMLSNCIILYRMLDAILRSIQDLFTSWEQVKVSHVARSFSASRPSTASAAFSIENMNILKQAVLEYTTFMDMDIVNASATSQRDKFERLSNQMARALELPLLRLPTDLKLSLKVIHQEINALLVKNVELKAKKTQYVNAVNEKESLYHEIDKAKNSLDEISSEVMVEDSLMMSLDTQMKEIQAKIDDCKARLAAKKCNAS
ncbi:Uncharacterized protein Adt_45278 [Abeliophyllum distichum]|uniref:Uncharacterized protein n=1 Tax=Abeliophyllum distichum TaxID=126358 RepID=A0ABD1PEM9_9LAMI